MKILIVGSGELTSQHGGGETYVRNLITGLSDRKHAIVYLSIVPGKVGEHLLNRFKHDALVEYQLIIPSNLKRYDDHVAITKLVTDVCCKIQPDVIHAHAWKQIIALAGATARIPTVITAHHGGIVCPAGALLNADDMICTIPASDRNCLRCCVRSVPGYKVWYPLLKIFPLKIRLILGALFNRLPFILFLTPLALLTRSIQTKQQEVMDIADYATCVIAPSPAIQQALVRNGIPVEKITMIPHGIPLPDASEIKVHSTHRPLRLIYFGRISYVKGLHVLFSACSGLSASDYELHIAGRSFSRADKKYEAGLIRQFSTVNAVWHGHKNHDEIKQLINECDVMVHPTICLEIFGLTIAESLAVGCPVVATRCGGPEIQVRDGVNGLLVPPNDVAALRTALQRSIDDPSLVEKLSRQAGSVRAIEQHVLDLEKIYFSHIAV